MSAFELPMDPMMEAFFVAVALELGTRTGEDWLDKRVSMGLPTTVAERNERSQAIARHQIEVAEFLKNHPGAPPVLAQLKRTHREAGGGLKRLDEDYFFWDQMAYAYIDWCRRQPVA